ncbi:MAG: Flp pilus assembly protein CpaB [Halobacteriovoraceae bacterium]|nr:Flp pilus assembly protein CpaB [Halobacteriovoraceae bacterium]|tara:strand:- start:23760 stop:24578 length:819 start_codon:yes stop_codon:yes gene_type:complete
MNSRAFTLSLVIAIMAVFMVQTYIEGEEAKFIAKYGEAKFVVKAKMDINELEVIDDSKVDIAKVPENYVQPGAFTKKEDLYNTIAAVPIKAGEQITKPRVLYPGSKTGLSRQIDQGKRAFSIRVSEDEAVAQLLKPGDRVDVLGVIDYAGGKIEQMKSKTVLHDVYVLATGKRVTGNIPMAGMKIENEIKKLDLNTYTNFRTVTLELTPDEVQKMAFLIKASKGIFLSLRNNDDKTVSRLPSAQLYDVLGDDDAGEAKTYFLEKKAREEKRK